MDVLIIGAGFIGRLHKVAWERNGAHVVAIVDPYLGEEDKLFYRVGGTEVLNDIHEALERYPEIAAASVCTPPKFHPEALTVLLARGLPVLMEKPVAVRESIYEAMLKETERTGGKVMVGLTQRFYPEVVKAAEWIRGGRIGRPIAVRDTLILSGEGLPAWYYDLGISGGGILITNGSHLLDRVQYLLNDELEGDVCCDGVLDDEGFDRLAYVSGSLSGGVPYSLHMEWSNAKERQETVILGTEGRIELQVWNQAVLLASDRTTEICKPYREDDDFGFKTMVGLQTEVRTFMDGLRPGAVFPKGLTLIEHLATMRSIWQGYRMLGRRTE
ncbi:Gfo/Idh/MocA family protein [Paenibacillaceae bacterium WGS1546]|uniref:Gfo/Idh/MocA family protein n=1 Tax=Cohnella sp. WGS1546 TaxID=3366810 RepID=UPI00372D716C